MILLDPPRDYHGPFKGCSHLISDEPGEAGTRELRRFAAGIGLRMEWLQKPGTPEEHFDVFGSRRRMAIEGGARQVDRRTFVEAIRRKRDTVRTPH